MLLTISTEHAPATDLGHLLGRNPDRNHTFPLPFGKAHVFYPVSTDARCTAALLLDVDTVRVSREARTRANDPKTLASFLNDRAYVASSWMSIALSRVFATAMRGESRDRPKVAEMAIPLTANLAVVRCREGEPLLRSMFEPFGYTVTATRIEHDAETPDGVVSPYFALELAGKVRLRDLLLHLHIGLPAIDDDGEPDVVDDELKKLIEKRGGILRTHPERERIAHRYLAPLVSSVPEPLARLLAEDDVDLAMSEDHGARIEAQLEAPLELAKHRPRAVQQALRSAGAKKVLHFASGDAEVLKALVLDPNFERVVAADVSQRALDRAASAIGIERLTPNARARLEFLVGTPVYRDARFTGLDAICLADVLELYDEERLPTIERVIFEAAAPNAVIVTTPNADFNPKLKGLQPGETRDPEHRFEWGRKRFEGWAEETASRFGYRVKLVPVGAEDKDLGAPTQMAVFQR